MRFFEKWAVRIGGGMNHRFGLYDMILVKDNHVDFAGGIPQAIRRVREYVAEHQLDIKIEIEVRNLTELQEVLHVGGVDIILLDNFDYATTRQAVTLVDGQYQTESSGNITLETVRHYADCGVDFISSGSLTHTIQSMDLSLKAFGNGAGVSKIINE
jgi:nicotinate-nucleotide pyrophosphorylase (carboxylating)